MNRRHPAGRQRTSLSPIESGSALNVLISRVDFELAENTFPSTETGEDGRNVEPNRVWWRQQTLKTQKCSLSGAAHPFSRLES